MSFEMWKVAGRYGLPLTVWTGTREADGVPPTQPIPTPPRLPQVDPVARTQASARETRDRAEARQEMIAELQRLAEHRRLQRENPELAAQVSEVERRMRHLQGRRVYQP